MPLKDKSNRCQYLRDWKSNNREKNLFQQARYRAKTKKEFNNKYLELLEDDFTLIYKEFWNLRESLVHYTNKDKWIKQICKVLSI